MTRKEFLGDMLYSVFGVKYIDYRFAEGESVYYSKGDSLYKDCTYSTSYKDKFRVFWDNLLNEKYKNIVFKGENGRTQTHTLKEYQEKAREYIFQFSSVKNEQDAYKLKEIITIPMIRHICLEIILEELFDIGEKRVHKDRGKDDFDEVEERIRKKIDSFLVENWVSLKSRMYKNNFFRVLVKQYPVFAELKLNENEQTIMDDIEEKKKQIQTFKITPCTVALNLIKTVEVCREIASINGSISAYCDKKAMCCEDFECFIANLVYLCNYSEIYIDIFRHKEDVEKLKNTAVRLYNYFYGKRHPEYKGNIQRAYWNVHPELIEYLFLLDSVLKAFDRKEEEEKKRQAALAENEQNFPSPNENDDIA